MKDKMKISLGEATALIINDNKFGNALFKFYVRRIIKENNLQNIELYEDDVIEIKVKHIVISFTWDMISAVNCKNNSYCDLLTTDDEAVFNTFN